MFPLIEDNEILFKGAGIGTVFYEKDVGICYAPDKPVERITVKIYIDDDEENNEKD